MSTTEKPPDAAAAAPATDPGPKSKATPTEYVILEQAELGQWVEQPERINATGQEAALTKHRAAGRGLKAPGLVAVPLRSWHPVAPETETREVTTYKPLT